MGKTVRVEWIGVLSPLQDRNISVRKSMGVIPPNVVEELEAVAELVRPLIRVTGTTARTKGPKHGYSKPYHWGHRPGTYIVDMEEIDADRLFNHDPDEAEFRNLDDPAHDDRKPVVPEAYITKLLADFFTSVHHGPPVVVTSVTAVNTLGEARKVWEESHDARQR